MSDWRRSCNWMVSALYPSGKAWGCVCRCGLDRSRPAPEQHHITIRPHTDIDVGGEAEHGISDGLAGAHRVPLPPEFSALRSWQS